MRSDKARQHDSDFNLNLTTGIRFGDNNGAEAGATYNGTNITITISDDICNGEEHPLELAGTLLHESIHALMYRNALLTDSTLSSDNCCLIWQDRFDTSDPCHEVMAEHYVQFIAQALSNLDGNIFGLDHYMYIAWGGLGEQGSQLGLISDEFRSEFYDQHQILTNAQFDFCNE